MVRKNISPPSTTKFRPPNFYANNGTLTTSWKAMGVDSCGAGVGYIVLQEVGYTYVIDHFWSPKIPHSAYTNWVALHIFIGPKVSQSKGASRGAPRVLAWGNIGPNKRSIF